MSEPGSPDESHAARRVILLVLAALAVALLAVALMTNARSPAGDSRPSITASPVPVGDAVTPTAGGG